MNAVFSRAQLNMLRTDIVDQYDYVRKFVERCERQQVPEHDLIYQAVRDVRDALLNLQIRLRHAPFDAGKVKFSERPSEDTHQKAVIKAMEAVGWRHYPEGPGTKPEKLFLDSEKACVIVEVDGTVHRAD